MFYSVKVIVVKSLHKNEQNFGMGCRQEAVTIHSSVTIFRLKSDRDVIRIAINTWYSCISQHWLVAIKTPTHFSLNHWVNVISHHFITNIFRIDKDKQKKLIFISCLQEVYKSGVAYDPEGLLGTLTSCLMCFMGLQVLSNHFYFLDIKFCG